MQKVQTPVYKVVFASDGDATLNSFPFSDPELRLPSTYRKSSPSLGLARKVALPTIFLSAAGWILFTIGFCIYRYKNMCQGTASEYPELYWAWATSVMGPVVYLLAGTHAVTRKRGVVWRRISAAVGSATALLGVAYTSALGYALIACSVFTYESTRDRYLYSGSPQYGQYLDYMGLMLAGSLLACFFWGVTLALWPWYTTPSDYDYYTTSDCDYWGRSHCCTTCTRTPHSKGDLSHFPLTRELHRQGHTE